MEGYDASTYGERFADVYDEWYRDVTPTDACVDAVAGWAGSGAVLELGVGTGRLAIPLAARGVPVTGIDSSPAMLQRLAAKPGGEAVDAIQGDMADPPVSDRRFAVVLVAYNTLFNLVDPARQAQCFRRAAALLAPGGRFVVEAFVPDPAFAQAEASVTPRTVTADKVVLSVTQADPTRQEIAGQLIDITEAGIRLRPWHLRWTTPEQLDEFAAASGLVLAERWAGWSGEPFTAVSSDHVSVYAAG